jgi:general secretion pathway protein J
MTTTPNRSRGFTLLEILVAVGVFAIFSALAYGSLDRILDSRDRIDAERQFWRQLAIAFTIMEDDLAMARGRTFRDVYGNPRAAFTGQPVDIRPQGDPSMAFTRGGVFVLSDSARPDLLRVGYRLTDGKLLRLTWPALDQPNQIQPQSAPLLDHVTEMKVRFYAIGSGWLEAWPLPTAALTALPEAVELTLQIEGRGQYQRIFRVNG